MRKIIDFLLGPYRKWSAKRARNKQVAELGKRDPFIYK